MLRLPKQSLLRGVPGAQLLPVRPCEGGEQALLYGSTNHVHVDRQSSDIPSSASLADTAGACLLTLGQGNAFSLFLLAPLWFLQTMSSYLL